MLGELSKRRPYHLRCENAFHGQHIHFLRETEWWADFGANQIRPFHIDDFIEYPARSIEGTLERHVPRSTFRDQEELGIGSLEDTVV